MEHNAIQRRTVKTEVPEVRLTRIKVAANHRLLGVIVLGIKAVRQDATEALSYE